MAYMELGLYTPRSFHTSCMILAVKWVPRSELTLKGSPNLEKMWFINSQSVVSAVSLGAGRHSIHFVNSQTTVRKYLLPRVDRGRGPTQFIWRSDHGKVIPFLCSGARWFGLAGWNWQHARHPLTHSRMSCCMPVCYMLECFIGGLDTVVSCACCIVSASSPFGREVIMSFGTVSGSGTYVRTPSRRCSMCLIE